MRINIPELLVHLRAKGVDADRGGIPSMQDLAMKAAGWAMDSPGRFAAAEKAVGLGRLLGKGRALPWPASPWTASRDLPPPPAETFRQWWARERG